MRCCLYPILQYPGNLFRAGELVAIRVPSVAEEAVRDLCRARADMVIDQTRGDASLMGAGRDRFLAMLAAARHEHPGRPVLLRSHPETAQGLRPGHLDDVLTCEGVEQTLQGRHGVYDMRVSNQKGQVVALFRGKSAQIQGTVIPEQSETGGTA